MSSSKVALLSGQTPWQDMSREELEREIEKAYYAVTQAVSALKQQLTSSGATSQQANRDIFEAAKAIASINKGIRKKICI